MDSAFAKLYLDLQAHIKATVPEIRFIEQYFGQDKFDNFREMVSFPCVLIDFPGTPYSALQGNSQLAAPVINFQLMMDVYSSTNSLSPLGVKEKGLQYLEFEHKLTTSLQGWSNDYTTPLVRIFSGSKNANPDGVRVRDINFTCEFEDWALEDDPVQVTFTFEGSIDH